MKTNTVAVSAATTAPADKRAELLRKLLRREIRPTQTIARVARPVHEWPLRVPVSASQRRLWFIDQMGFGAKAYYVSATLTFKGRLDAVLLRRAFDALVQRHESLRTTFVAVEGEPQQQIAGEGSFELREIDLRGADVEAQRTIEREQRFDLSSGPLIRGRLLRRAEHEHLLLITVHHIIFDAWSMEVLTRELTELYSAFSQGRELRLPALPIQYADYVAWQRQYLEQRLDHELNYWRSRLAGVPPEIALPLDRPRSAEPTHRGASIEIALDAKLTAQLNALARRHDVTLYMVLCAAWAVLLSRLSGQDDIVIGTQIANRQHPELETAIGVFANTLVLRIGVAARARIDALLQQVKEVTLGAFDHQDVPFDRVVEALRPERTLSRNPLFQVMFILQNTPRSELRMPGLSVTVAEGMSGYATVDLLLLLEERGAEIRGTIDYAVDLFDRATVERWQQCFIEVLRDIADDVACCVADLSLLPGSQRAELVKHFNQTDAIYPSGRLLHELFEEQVVRTPDALAVICDDQSLTYAGLNDRAERLSRRLLGQGVAPGQLVALCMERSVDVIVGLLGILKAGAAYLPLDPSHPRDRLTYMLEDASPSVLLTQERLAADLPPTTAKVIAIDAAVDDAAPVSATESSKLTSRDLAYVIYTSGSTGAPKAVMIEHESVVNLLSSMATAPGIRATDGFLAVTTLSFDIAALECFLPLLVGAKVVLATREAVQDTQRLIHMMDSGDVTMMQATPALWRLLIDAGWRGSPQLVALCGGEALSSDLAASLTGRVRELWNVYGPTETTIWSCRHRIGATSQAQGGVESIGGPVANTRIYILDDSLEPVPIGVAGEIYIGGAGLARGYMKRPALTAEKFIPDPFGTHSGARLYTTGDLGRWRADGTIDFLGRNDGQVKIRGFRIETGEVEACLRRHPAVKDAVVLARDAAVAGDRQLAAYIIASTVDDGSLIAALRDSLREWLPEYMIPSGWTLVERWPLTSSGKVDRKALPAPMRIDTRQREFAAPRTDLEQALATIWSQVLGVDTIGRDDNFFDLGGHSLLAIRAIFRINETLGAKLTGADLYKSPTVADLSRRVREGESEDRFVDLSTEAVLDESIVAMKGSPAADPRAILLTGATGFVGRFLLVQLLQDTDATLYCLVRANSEAEAARRLEETLVSWDLWQASFANRIVAVPGDLRAPGLGIEPATYEQLAQTIDAVYHCATQMNHLETYSASKAANVESSRALVRFAAQRRPKLINFISTLDVFSAETGDGARCVDERTPIDFERHRASQGYVASKWVGEKIFMLAGERGVACNIFRLGLIWADAAGRYDERQREHRLLQSCLASGYGIRDFHYETPPTPVDYAARAIVALAKRNPRGGGIFHIAATEQMSEGVFERCNAVAGTSLTLLPRHEWTGVMERLHAQGRALPIVPLIEQSFGLAAAMFYEREEQASRRPKVDCSSTHAALEQAGIVAPRLNDDRLRACVNRLGAFRPSSPAAIES